MKMPLVSDFVLTPLLVRGHIIVLLPRGNTAEFGWTCDLISSPILQAAAVYIFLLHDTEDGNRAFSYMKYYLDAFRACMYMHMDKN